MTLSYTCLRRPSQRGVSPLRSRATRLSVRHTGAGLVLRAVLDAEASGLGHRVRPDGDIWSCHELCPPLLQSVSLQFGNAGLPVSVESPGGYVPRSAMTALYIVPIRVASPPQRTAPAEMRPFPCQIARVAVTRPPCSVYRVTAARSLRAHRHRSAPRRSPDRRQGLGISGCWATGEARHAAARGPHSISTHRDRCVLALDRSPPVLALQR